MKKTLSFLLILSLLLPLVACGNSVRDQFPEELTLETLHPILNTGRATLVSSTAGGQSGETAAKLFDGDLSTKLCTDAKDYEIVWKLNRDYLIGGYVITTANDSEITGRVPRGWKLEASKDGVKWVTLSNIGTSRLENKNFTDYFYAVSKPDAYQFFRFTLTSASRMTQMAEITMYGPQRPGKTDEEVDFSDNANASAGLELLKTMIKDYYDSEGNIVRKISGRDESADMWGVATFLEALAEGYRLCPNDTQIYNTYVDILNFVLTTYDSNRQDYKAWICIQYLNAYNLLGEAVYLRRAEDLLDSLWSGWDDERLNGGIYAQEDSQSKETMANAPVAVAFLSAYEITEFDDYLEKGKQIYEWCHSTLLDGNLYANSVSKRGELDTWKSAYNQGTMLVAGSLLYQLTREGRYLEETRALYNATVELMFDSADGYVSMNGNPIYKGSSMGWLMRGFILYEKTDDNNTTTGTEYMNRMLNFNLRTKDGNGYYDPYFRTGEWTGEVTREILQPSGVASAYLLAGIIDKK